MLLKISDDLAIPLSAITAIGLLSLGADRQWELVAATAARNHSLWKGTEAECRAAYNALLLEFLRKGGEVVALPTDKLTSTPRPAEAEATTEATPAKPKPKTKKGGAR